MKVKFSIITPFYNSYGFIPDYVKNHFYNEDDINNQIEFIFIDDFSTDDSFRILKKYVKKLKNFKILKNKKNLGPGLSRLKGAKSAIGEYLIFLDIDDKINLKEKIYLQYKKMVTQKFQWSFTQFSIDGVFQLPEVLEIKDINYILRYRYLAMSSVMIKRSLFLKYEKYMSISSYSCEDYIIWINLILDNHYPIYIKNTVMIYNKSDKSLSSNKLKQALNVFSIYIKFLGYKKGFINFLYYVLNKL